MNDQHTKIWLSVFVFTLMAVGGAASFLASQGKTFFKGLEPLRDVMLTSVLNVETENPERTQLKNFELLPEAENAMAQGAPEVQDSSPPKESLVSSPCPADKLPVIKNGKIESCGRHEEKKTESQKVAVKISAPLAPAPKVRILTEPSTSYNLTSCESQGRFTYTGPDRPGLLYGMCIECETSRFIMQGGKCS